MNYLGMDGYLDIMRGLMATTEKFRTGIESIAELRIMGNLIGPLLTFTSDVIDTYAVCDLMDDRGWNLDRNTNPNGLHMMISPLHEKYVDEFLADLEMGRGQPWGISRVEARYNWSQWSPRSLCTATRAWPLRPRSLAYPPTHPRTLRQSLSSATATQSPRR